MTMHALDDTIAALATAPGESGLAVIRVSGPHALAVADAVFRGGARLAGAASHTLHHGWAVAAHADTRLDEVVAALFRAPRSYTREDVVELSCHGGRVAAGHVLDALIAAGARLARPGEFTLRAFLSGRIDLAQAEAVADLIAADSGAAHAIALSQLSGALSRSIHDLSSRLEDTLAEVEARVDFAEDVGGLEVPPAVVDAIRSVDRDLAAMLDGAAWGRAVREGVRVPIVGRPNAGKSSLFNALIGEERAIVTAIPGTTRDRVSEAVEIAGVRVTLSDTAGLRESAEPIEAIGVARAREALDGAAVALWVVDGSVPLGDEDRWIGTRLAGRRAVVALAKHDLPAAVSPAEIEAMLAGSEGGSVAGAAIAAEAARGAAAVAAPSARVVPVSAVRGDGLAALRGAIAAALGVGCGAGSLAAAVSNPRHADALARARAALARAVGVADDGQPGEIVALELRAALAALGEITGRGVGEELLERIFARFCVGK
jgi:tRNA modification GTPase